jgi:hypothetical protein
MRCRAGFIGPGQTRSGLPGEIASGSPPGAWIPRRIVMAGGGFGRSFPPILWFGTSQGIRDDIHPVRLLSFSRMSGVLC